MPVSSQSLPSDIRLRPKRRSARLNSRVPVSIEWNGSGGPLRFESAYTRVINSYGCLLVSPREVDLQQKMRLTNLATRDSAEAVVVWKGSRRPDGWDLGVALVSQNLNFWGFDF